MEKVIVLCSSYCKCVERLEELKACGFYDEINLGTLVGKNFFTEDHYETPSYLKYQGVNFDGFFIDDDINTDLYEDVSTKLSLARATFDFKAKNLMSPKWLEMLREDDLSN